MPVKSKKRRTKKFHMVTDYYSEGRERMEYGKWARLWDLINPGWKSLKVHYIPPDKYGGASAVIYEFPNRVTISLSEVTKAWIWKVKDATGKG